MPARLAKDLLHVQKCTTSSILNRVFRRPIDFSQTPVNNEKKPSEANASTGEQRKEKKPAIRFHHVDSRPRNPTKSRHTLPSFVMVVLYVIASPTEALLSPLSSTKRPVMVVSTCAGSTPHSQEQFAELLVVVSPRGLPKQQAKTWQQRCRLNTTNKDKLRGRLYILERNLWFSWSHR